MCEVFAPPGKGGIMFCVPSPLTNCINFLYVAASMMGLDIGHVCPGVSITGEFQVRFIQGIVEHSCVNLSQEMKDQSPK